VSQSDWDCDLSRGDVQCPFVTANGTDGVLCCGLREGHPGEHSDAYGFKHVEWSEP